MYGVCMIMGNTNGFIYNKEWENEVFKFGLQKYLSKYERDRLEELINHAMYSADRRVIEPLILILTNSDHLLGQTQSIYGVLGCTDQNKYFEALFTVLPEVIKVDPDAILNCLAIHDIDNENINSIMEVVNNLISQEVQRKIVNLIEQYNCKKDAEYSLIYRKLKNGIESS